MEAESESKDYETTDHETTRRRWMEGAGNIEHSTFAVGLSV